MLNGSTCKFSKVELVFFLETLSLGGFFYLFIYFILIRFIVVNQYVGNPFRDPSHGPDISLLFQFLL